MKSHEYSALYDAPGPKTRRRIRLTSGITVLAIAGIAALALWQFGSQGQLAPERWTPFLQWDIWRFLLVGLGGTLQAAAVIAVLGGALGVLFAVGRISRFRLVRVLSAAYIEVARTVPALLLIYVMLFVLPAYGFNPPTLWKLAVPLTITNSAAIAEIVRAGILSMPRGQSEAGLSLGLRPGRVMQLIILPQAFRRVTPSLVSQFVSLLKDTSLGYVVAFTELLYRAQVLTSFNDLLIQTYILVALIYLLCNGSLSALATRLQRRVDRRSSAAPSKRAHAPIPADVLD